MLTRLLQTRARAQEIPTVPGTPLVAVKDPAVVFEQGLLAPDGIRFGLLTHGGEVMYRHAACASHACIKRVSCADFAPAGYSLYLLPPMAGQQDGAYDYEASHRRAMEGLLRQGGGHPAAAPSPMGDDFVYECLTGESFLDAFDRHPMWGVHLGTPLDMSPADIIRFITGKKYETLDVCTVLKLTHHAIVIGEGLVAHFATHRMPDGVNRLKIDTLEAFMHTSKGSRPADTFPVHHPGCGSAQARLRARNQAIRHVMDRRQWGGYNLLSNNCEHFCYHCCEGRFISPQVQDATRKLLLGSSIFTDWRHLVPEIPLDRIAGGVRSAVANATKAAASTLRNVTRRLAPPGRH